jgi:hypothetical protein
VRKLPTVYDFLLGSRILPRMYGSMDRTSVLSRKPPSRDTVSGSMVSESTVTVVLPGTGYPEIARVRK